MNEQYRKAIEYLILDLKKPIPELSNCIFSVKELIVSANLSVKNEEDLILFLHSMHCIQNTNKLSQYGVYYTVSRRLYRRFRKNRADRKWIGFDRPLEDGFCIINTPDKILRLNCEGTECKFFLSSKNICIKNKFFHII